MTTPPNEKATKLNFDKAILQQFRETMEQCFLEHPELRSVSVMLDFHGGLNDSPNVIRGMWVGDEGRIEKPEAIFGSLHNTLHILEAQMSRASEVMKAMQEATKAAGLSLLQKQQELDKNGG